MARSIGIEPGLNKIIEKASPLNRMAQEVQMLMLCWMRLLPVFLNLNGSFIHFQYPHTSSLHPTAWRSSNKEEPNSSHGKIDAGNDTLLLL